MERRVGGRRGGASLRETRPSSTLRAPRPFEDFYRKEFPAAVGLAYALSGSRAGAEDLAQEAFLAAHRNWSRVSEYDKPEAWVRRVVANMSESLIRRRVVEARGLARLANRREPALSKLEVADAEFWAAVRSLPKRQRQVVALHYLEDLPVSRIAEILDVAEGTVKAHLHAARGALAAKLHLEEGSA
jgi:RNA polymerase sigma-70 factor (ECF subfamily)